MQRSWNVRCVHWNVFVARSLRIISQEKKKNKISLNVASSCFDICGDSSLREYFCALINSIIDHILQILFFFPRFSISTIKYRSAMGFFCCLLMRKIKREILLSSPIITAMTSTCYLKAYGGKKSLLYASKRRILQDISVIGKSQWAQVNTLSRNN